MASTEGAATRGTLERARASCEARAWRDAYDAYASASEIEALGVDDLERYATAARLLGDVPATERILTRGYRRALEDRDVRAARFAFFLGHELMYKGRVSEGSGWFARGRQLVAGMAETCPEVGFLLIPDGVQLLEAGKNEEAQAVFERALAIGQRCEDPTLVAAARHGRGRALVRRGLVREGMEVLDELIVAVSAGEVPPLLVGDVYCGVLEACHEVFEFRRAREWTGALARWCEGQQDLVAYRGTCLVYRAEVLQSHGLWSDALAEARRACEWLESPATPETAADAFYRLAELERLLGNDGEAERCYQRAGVLGRRSSPGLQLLWLRSGRVDAAHSAVERALLEEEDLSRRALLLDAAVEIASARGDAGGAAAAATELATLAERLGTSAAQAMASTAAGSAAITAGDMSGALAPLRQAWSLWQQLEAPYEAARVRRLIGIAYQRLGDDQSAAMEFDAARMVFEQLGAAPDAADVAGRLRPAGGHAPGGLTARELDVVRLLAKGQTNRQIGAALYISEHTVARHVQNLLTKLGVPSRAALAAFAAQQGIVDPPTEN